MNHKAQVIALSKEVKLVAKLEHEQCEMACQLQELELPYATVKVHPLKPSVPSSTAAQAGSLFTPAPWARFDDAVEYNEAIEVDNSNDDEEMEEDEDKQIFPPHPAKNPPRKVCPPVTHPRSAPLLLRIEQLLGIAWMGTINGLLRPL
jgi:hypothetical protein